MRLPRSFHSLAMTVWIFLQRNAQRCNSRIRSMQFTERKRKFTLATPSNSPHLSLRGFPTGLPRFARNDIVGKPRQSRITSPPRPQIDNFLSISIKIMCTLYNVHIRYRAFTRPVLIIICKNAPLGAFLTVLSFFAMEYQTDRAGAAMRADHGADGLNFDIQFTELRFNRSDKAFRFRLTIRLQHVNLVFV